MAVVVGFNVHREQITLDALDELTGEVRVDGSRLPTGTARAGF